MRIVNGIVIERFVRKHADSRSWLDSWHRNAEEIIWTSIQEVRLTYPAADGGVRVGSGGEVTGFNVCGNKYRMICSVVYATATVIVHEIMTHAEYSKNLWKRKY